MRLLLMCSAVMALVVYWPGLTGSFMLDDFGTLPPLAQWGEINTFDKLLQFVFGGFSGPTGRPVALLSFVLNSTTWPADPYYFLLTNVLIHVINGLLIALILSRILVIANVQEAKSLAIFAASIWLLHPSHVSTVLYVVQRMAQLELLFNLLAIWAYIVFREACIRDQLKKSVIYIFLLGLSSGMALCSKENAILIPLQLLLIEWLIQEGRSTYGYYFKLSKWLVIYIPSAIVIAYLVDKWSDYIFAGLSNSRRSFTVWERQLTEFRVVGDYLWMFFVPKLQTSGVFHDGYGISKNIFTPITTLYWAGLHSILIITAVVFRNRWRLLSFAIAWFYVNHLIESTIIQLELKFEHRNYLPSIGLALLVAMALHNTKISKRLRYSLFSLLAIVLSVMLYLRAELWGRPEVAANIWVSENKASSRALEHAAIVYSGREGGGRDARGYLRSAVELADNDPVVELKFISFTCYESYITDIQLQSLVRRLPDSEVNWQVASVFDEILQKLVVNKCPKLDLQSFDSLVVAALANPKYSALRIPMQLMHSRAYAELKMGSKEKAVAIFLSEFSSKNIPLDLIMKQSVLMAGEGELIAAYKHIDRALKQGNLAISDTVFLRQQAQDVRDKIKSDIPSLNQYNGN